jgi:hypothetical protein
MMVMKVYVVMIGYYAEGYTVEAVCGSPMLANQIKDKLQEDEAMESGGGEVVVKEYPVLTNIQQFNLGGLFGEDAHLYDFHELYAKIKSMRGLEKKGQ